MTTPAPWHTLAPSEAAERLGVDARAGLGPAEVQRRLTEHGPNEIAAAGRRSVWAMLWAQLTDVMVLVLVGAALVSGFLGEVSDTVAIVVIVVLNAALGFAQEYRAERAMEALRSMAAPSVKVRRDGVVRVIASAELVPGDVVLLEAGNLVPADLRLTEAAQLRVEESALTGESLPVDKGLGAVEADASLGDRSGMAWRGTLVVNGRGEGVVVATGMGTEIGRIASMLAGAEDTKTPLQRRLAAFGRRLTFGVLALCGLLFGLGLARGDEPVSVFLTALSLAVAAIPEALPAVITVALSLGARRMVASQALVRSLPAVETLGSVTWICSDKTGTLTQNRMVVVEVWPPLPDGQADRQAGDHLLLDALALCHDARREADGDVAGDPTEVALYEAAEAAGHSPSNLNQARPRTAEVPFSSERARMSTVHDAPDHRVVFTKGAPERMVGLCRFPEGTGPTRNEVLARAEGMAERGLRVLAFATRRVHGELPDPLHRVEEELDFLGLVGMQDPPRPEAAAAVATCRAAGIRVSMITGDHPGTAAAIARSLGILEAGGEVLTGRELEQADDAELARRLGDVAVFARVAPEQKIRIVTALQRRGELVAMTGDGVNDAPALRQADIGVAMGKDGTDVAREAADMVLLDDHFATIVRAVGEGRRIYDNIRRFVRFALTGNSGEIWALVLAPLFGLPIPLTPLQILWVNLITDGLPGLALSVEPAEKDVMSRPPRPPGESILARGLWQGALWAGLLIGGTTFGVQVWAIHSENPHWQSLPFTVLTFAQMAHVLAVRSERQSLFQQGVFTNPALLAAVGLTVLLQLAVIYLPPLQRVFGTSGLGPVELAVCVGAGVLVFAGVELEKWFVRRGWLYAEAATAARPAPGSAPR